MRPHLTRPSAKDQIMKLAVKTIEGGSAGEIELADAVFGAPVRQDILHRCVVWQLSRRQQGTHKTKGRAEVQATAKKMYAQKGTGRPATATRRPPQFRGGGKASVRSCAAMPATCPRRSARWRCAARCRPRPPKAS
jgi:hypothetical protein